MKSKLFAAFTVSAFGLALAGCGGSSLPNGWEKAAEACALAYTFDQVVQSGGQGFDPERVREGIDQMQASAIAASDSSSEYDQLQMLVGNLVYSIDKGDTGSVLDLVAVEGECSQLGFGTEPPQ